MSNPHINILRSAEPTENLFIPFLSIYASVHAFTTIYYRNARNAESNRNDEWFVQQKQDTIISRNINFATRHLVFSKAEVHNCFYCH